MKSNMEEQQDKINDRMSKIKHKIVVMSGKGGVGNNCCCKPAYALSLMGKKVGLLDIDLHGPNTAKCLTEGKRFKQWKRDRAVYGCRRT